jgi:SAM-dependent methyltransferase
MAEFDSKRAEEFAGKLLQALNDGALCLMVSIGHRTGLFDSMRGEAGATSQQIASRAGLNERYVREWLGAMTTGGVVDVDETSTRFRLPDEHAAFLTRAAAADNMAAFAQYIPLLGNVEDDIIASFKNGGGVPYEKFPRFHDVMAEDSGQSVMSSLESHIVPLVPELAPRLASGVRWLDLGCGRGMIIARLAELYPKSSFVGVDLSRDAISWAQGHASSKKLRNVEFVVKDLSDFDQKAERDAFDVVSTFDAVHDQAHAARHSSHVEKRRALPDAGHQGLELRAQQHRAPAGHLPLHGLVHALYDGIARARRGGPGCHVGRREDARVPRPGGLRFRPKERARARSPEQLVRGAEVTRDDGCGETPSVG